MYLTIGAYIAPFFMGENKMDFLRNYKYQFIYQNKKYKIKNVKVFLTFTL